MREKILISACLIGENCRYDGKNNLVKDLLNLSKKYDLIPICPEVCGGLSIPRAKAEIKDGRVVTEKGRDVTEQYESGAYWAYSICSLKNIKIAILKENSPSCGSLMIHDGSFTDKKIPGMGITAKKLLKLKVKIYNENNYTELLKVDDNDR